MAKPVLGPNFRFRAFDALLCLLLAGLWTLPTFLNGFPLSYYDSAFYTFNTFNLFEPARIAWRPLTYSLFLRLPVELFGFSGAIFLQNLVVVSVLLKVSRLIFKEISRRTFFVVATLLLFTPLVHVGNFIMPDIFSPLAVLVLLALFYCAPKDRPLYAVATVVFSLMHFANLLCVIPLALFHYAKSLRKQLVLGGLVVVLLLGARLMLFFPQKSFEESAHYFLYSRLVAFGITEVYHSQVCPREDLVFCNNETRRFAIWSYDRKPNGVAPGIDVLPSVVTSNQEIMTSPLVWTYIFKSFYQSFIQLTHFSRPMEILIEDLTLVRQYGAYAGGDALKAFTQPRIFNNRHFSLKDYRRWLENYFLLVSCLSLLYLAWLVHRSDLDQIQERFLYYYVAAYVLHSLAIGFLSEPLGRYNNKFIWVFTYLAVVYAFHSRHAEKAFSKGARESTTHCESDPVSSAS